MKVIFSRKGFDSSYGKMASPILPAGQLVPLPIPNSKDQFQFRDINIDNIDVGHLLKDLSDGAWTLNSRIHLDPDLARPMAKRLKGWRPALGQSGAAQSHLSNQGVGPGDVFLFFGWFRQAEFHKGHWRYTPKAPDLHVLFGWLEVADVISVVTAREQSLAKYPWIADHPHVANPVHYDSDLNTLYVAAEQSRFVSDSDFGAGRFKSYSDSLNLTQPCQSRSVWNLPPWFLPSRDRPPLTYHENLTRWTAGDEHVQLKSVAKGQEFVIDGNSYPELEGWLKQLIGSNA